MYSHNSRGTQALDHKNQKFVDLETFFINVIRGNLIASKRWYKYKYWLIFHNILNLICTYETLELSWKRKDPIESKTNLISLCNILNMNYRKCFLFFCKLDKLCTSKHIHFLSVQNCPVHNFLACVTNSRSTWYVHSLMKITFT